MIEYILYPFIFGIAYAIKGGQGDDVFRNWDRNPLSNKATSTVFIFIVLCFTTVFYEQNIGALERATHSILAVTLAWLVSIAPSLGEEYGALLGRTDEKYGKWMPEKKTLRILGKKFQWIEGHEYGVKKAVQRGVFSGACMTVATGYIGFIVASLAFMPLAWLCLNYAPKKILDPWGWSEFLIGAICYGLPFALMLS